MNDQPITAGKGFCNQSKGLKHIEINRDHYNNEQPGAEKFFHGAKIAEKDNI